jgi:hypothetical protein
VSWVTLVCERPSRSATTPNRDADGEQRGRRGVPRVVQPDDPHPGIGGQGPPRLPVAVLVQRSGVRPCEDKIAVLPAVAGPQPLGELRGPVGPEQVKRSDVPWRGRRDRGPMTAFRLSPFVPRMPW